MLCTTCNFEFFWMVIFVYVVVAGIVDILLKIIGQLTRGKLTFGLNLRVYAMMHVVIRSAQGLLDFAMSSFIAGLMGATIIALYLSISSYSLIPVAIYWMFPNAAVISISILQILVIPFIYMCEESAAIILKLKIVPAYVSQNVVGNPINVRKLVRRRINAMRPFAFYAGLFDYRFHKLVKSSKLSIIDTISGVTVSALLAKRK